MIYIFRSHFGSSHFGSSHYGLSHMGWVRKTVGTRPPQLPHSVLQWLRDPACVGTR